ncbi:hypothetical protein MKW92_047932 [Papaver armeniacum]|nr:hypothetical protein MKW92_047932 [Papaver armeniacum]
MDNQQAHTANSVEFDQSNSMDVVTPTEDIYPVLAPTQGSELTRGVEVGSEVTIFSATKQDKFPGAGQLYEEGKHRGKVLGDGFVDVGGFDIPKTEASLYKEIWLNYGHIASNRVLTDSYYYSQVVVLSELLSFIVKMNACPLEEVSSEVIDDWESNIRVAENLNSTSAGFERLEDIKIVFAEEEKLRETLAEQNEAKARVIEAEQQLFLAKERLSALETKIPPLLMAKQNFRNKCGGPLLLFNGRTNLSPVTAPVLEDAILNDEPTDNNSKGGPSTGIVARKTRLISSLNM